MDEPAASPLRAALLIVSGLAAAVFAAAFAATFFAKGHITRLAEDYVIDRTRTHVDPLVRITEQGLRAPGAKLVLNDEQLQAARREVAEYRQDPRAYIAKLVAEDGAPAVADPGPGAPLKDQVLHWKGEIRAYFGRTLDRLLFDLRIFTGSNLIAALATFGLAYAGRRDRLRRLLLVAGLLLASMAYMTYVYVDQLSYFRILINSYMGWWYPALLGLTVLGADLEHGRPAPPAPDSTGAK
jgi:hypothetical protein